jgi:alkanesulfonate monooxygenase SsuD/methylene tetrahydromethanopterin reductase-like flavin-dependent oxidoreductase (luciferase family)
MHFGIEVVPFGPYADPRQVVHLAQAAEAAGWEGLWIWDHMLFPYGVGDPWVTLSAVAASTQHIILVTGVAVLPRYQPLNLARTLACLDILSQGRVILGAGAGAIDGEFASCNGPTHPRTRAGMLDESLELISLLGNGKKVDFDGDHYHIHAAPMFPTPVQKPRIPVWIGGESKPALRRASRWDGWIIGIIDEAGSFIRSPEQLEADINTILEQRKVKEPFEVAVDGISQPDNTSLVKEYEHAGATWWFEGIYGSRGSHDEMLARIKAGPPAC